MKSFRVLIVFVLLSLTAIAQQYDPSLYQEMKWRSIGPFRGGRSPVIAGVPNKPNLFYFGANNGGVWKSTDYGLVWKPIFDGQPSQSIGAMAIAPSNSDIIYVGSGEGLQRPDLSVGDGMYKSTDGGTTWTHLGLREGMQISSIAVDPKNPDRLFVAVLGHPYGANTERGVFRSLDGGKNFERVLYKNENVGAMEVVLAPDNPQVVYADLWAARRPPWTTGNSINGKGSGLFKSTNGGTTWKQIGEGLPTEKDGLGRIGFSIAPTDSNRMYAIADANARAGGLFISNDAGATFTRINNEQRIWSRASDFAEVRVHPKDKDTIFVANTSTYKSTDGGKNFTAIKGSPGGDDYHTVWINPNNPDIIFLGLDQGVTISVNGGETWSSWYNQPTAQFYHVITDNRWPYWVYGGQQESGSAGTASRGDHGGISVRDWRPVGAFEYDYVAPDPLNSDIIYGSQGLKYNFATGQTQDVSPYVIRSAKYRFNRTKPMIFSQADPHILYLGSQVLFKTMNGGQSWDIISPDLTRPQFTVPSNLDGIIDDEARKVPHYGVIYSIGPSFKEANTVWIGTDDGLVQLTRDSGKTWQNVTPPELTPWSKIAQITASHYDENTAYIAVNKLRLDDMHAYIYRTHDGGKTWQKITNGIPDNAPVNTVREDHIRKGLLVAGTETSIWFSEDDGDHWLPLQNNLPHTSMRDLVIHEDDIVVGTHGRSFWILDDITPLRQFSAEVTGANAFLFAPQTAVRVRRNTNTDTPLQPETPMGQNPPDGAIIDYTLKASAKEPVVLEIFDSYGKLARRYSSADKLEQQDPKEINVPMYWVRPSRGLSAEAGMHRFVWDMHYTLPDFPSRDYPISANYMDTPKHPLGVSVLPGTYKVKLSVGSWSQTRTLTVRMDPRVKATQTQLEQQFALETKLSDGIDQAQAVLKKVKALRAQIKTAMADSKAASVTDKLKELDAQLTQLEGSGGGRRGGGGGNTDSFASVAGNMQALYDVVDAADAEPTTQAFAMFTEIQEKANKVLVQWTALLDNDVKKMNEQLIAAGVNPLH